jgi:hypothetical protein
MERDDDYKSRFLTKEQLAELDEYRNGMERYIYAPNSIYHGEILHQPGRLPFSNETVLKVEIGRLHDFIDFLFNDKEYCDHATERQAWDEFEQFEYSEIINNQKSKP